VTVDYVEDGRRFPTAFWVANVRPLRQRPGQLTRRASDYDRRAQPVHSPVPRPASPLPMVVVNTNSVRERGRRRHVYGFDYVPSFRRYGGQLASHQRRKTYIRGGKRDGAVAKLSLLFGPIEARLRPRSCPRLDGLWFGMSPVYGPNPGDTAPDNQELLVNVEPMVRPAHESAPLVFLSAPPTSEAVGLNHDAPEVRTCLFPQAVSRRTPPRNAPRASAP